MRKVVLAAVSASLIGTFGLGADVASAVVPSPPTSNIRSCLPATIVNFGGAPSGTPGLFEHLVIEGGPGLAGGVVAAAQCA
jgi:hypothetical protein